MCKPGTGPHTWPYTNTEHTHPFHVHIYAHTHTQAHTCTHTVQKRHLVSISLGGQFASGNRADISRGGQKSGQWGVVVVVSGETRISWTEIMIRIESLMLKGYKCIARCQCVVLRSCQS